MIREEKENGESAAKDFRIEELEARTEFFLEIEEHDHEENQRDNGACIDDRPG